MELDRINYLLASYLRTRLFKIEKNALHILMNEEAHGRLSAKEFESVSFCPFYEFASGLNASAHQYSLTLNRCFKHSGMLNAMSIC